MMNVVKGNLLEVTHGVLAHQVNCVGVMGAGVARQVADKYPVVYAEYKRLCRERSANELLGTVQIVQVNNLRIANVFGQRGYGRGQRHTNYVALRLALTRLAETMMPGERISFPYGIGCGLAGGDWDVVSQIIEDVFGGFRVYLYKL